VSTAGSRSLCFARLPIGLVGKAWKVCETKDERLSQARALQRLLQAWKQL